MAKRYFEDFSAGQAWTFDAWSLTEPEIISFAAQHDPQPMHTDPAAAAAGPYGGIIASGWQTALNCITPFLRAVMADTPNLGSPGLDSYRWIAPVRPGDAITPRTTVLRTRESGSRPDRGIVTFAIEGFDSGNSAVFRAEPVFFVFRRP